MIIMNDNHDDTCDTLSNEDNMVSTNVSLPLVLRYKLGRV